VLSGWVGEGNPSCAGQGVVIILTSDLLQINISTWVCFTKPLLIGQLFYGGLMLRRPDFFDGRSSVRNSIEGGLCWSGARSTWPSFSLLSPQLLRNPARSLAPFAFFPSHRSLRTQRPPQSPPKPAPRQPTVQHVVARPVTVGTTYQHTYRDLNSDAPCCS
jgi:hypothetical protein